MDPFDWIVIATVIFLASNVDWKRKRNRGYSDQNRNGRN